MSNIHYFARYTQKENMVTNNTMLLFKRLHNNSTDKFNRFLNSILEDSGIELDIDIKFGQQEKGYQSVPDAYIQQDSFKIIIETKLYGQQDISQLKNHFTEFEDIQNQVFLWVNKEPIADKYRKQIIKEINKINNKRQNPIFFAATTFKEICEIFNEILNDYDFEMKEIVEDFEAFCNEAGIIDNADTKIRFVPVGDTLVENMKYNIYYDPSYKGYQNHHYIGLYNDKTIKGVGKIVCIVDANYTKASDKMTTTSHLGTLTDSQTKMIKEVMNDAYNNYGYKIFKDHRFFIVDKFYETEFTKESKGGMVGKRYFDLSTLKDYKKKMSTQEIAELLSGKEWY